MIWRTHFILGALLLWSMLLTAQDRRFPGEDRNGDGVISRQEWWGNSRRFERLDRNGDGVLARSEINVRRNRRADTNTSGTLDRNRSGAVDQYEWPYNFAVFNELDRNDDGRLTRTELNDMSGVTLDKLDQNRNRQIEADEWPGGFAEFRDLDQNNDGQVSSQEYFERGGDWQRRRRFSMWDTNRDNIVHQREWKSDAGLFTRLDVDRDKQLTWQEFNSDPTEWARSQAHRLDRNSTGRVEGYEWPYNRDLFHQLDTDADSTLSAAELRSIERATLGQLDKNKDGRVAESEWPGGFAHFRDLDKDGNGRISAEEYFERGTEWQRLQRFRAWDQNRDGIVQSTEWKSDSDLFHNLDTNANSQIEWEEYRNSGSYRGRMY